MCFKVVYIKCILISFFWGIVVSCEKASSETLDLVHNTRISIPKEQMISLLPENKALINDSCSSMTFIVYYDSASCSVCQLRKISIWNKIISESYRLGGDIDLLFIFSPKVGYVSDFIQEYYSLKVKHKVYIDSLGCYERENHIVRNFRQFNSVVINKNGRIIFVGNPAEDVSIERLYYSFLQDKQYLCKVLAKDSSNMILQ